MKCSSALCQLEGQQCEPGAGSSLECLSGCPQRDEKLEERHPSRWEMGNGTIAAGPQESRGEIRISRAIFSDLGCPRHQLSAGE